MGYQELLYLKSESDVSRPHEVSITLSARIQNSDFSAKIASSSTLPKAYVMYVTGSWWVRYSEKRWSNRVEFCYLLRIKLAITLD